jgi:hypothetical protein
METYKFIYSEFILKAFYDEVFGTCPLRSDDEYRLVAASSRNKELTKEEREYYGISDKEMYHTEPIFYDNWKEFYSKICKFECNVNGFMTKLKQVPLPQKSLTLYMNLNPISIKKSFLYKYDQMGKVIKTCINSRKEVADANAIPQMRKCLKLQNAVAMECLARRDWIDYDIDFEDAINAPYVAKENYIKPALKSVLSKGRYVIVRSKGGLHLLIPTSMFDSKTNPTTIEKALKEALAGIGCKEIKEVRGGVPLPGCLQREFPVTFETADWDGTSKIGYSP